MFSHHDPRHDLNVVVGTGIKLAKALGCTVTAISRSNAKEAFARSCGADDYIATSSAEQLASAAGSLDIILNTIPVYRLEYTSAKLYMMSTQSSSPAMHDACEDYTLTRHHTEFSASSPS